MNQGSKSVMSFIGLMLIYILLALLGFYKAAGIMLFPILSIPLALCLIKNELALGVDFLFNIAIISGIYFLTNNIESVLVYVISVCVPAYAVTILYKRGTPLPNMIMYLLVTVATIIFIYLAVMKQVGVDYKAQFITLMDESKKMYFEALRMMVESKTVPSVLEASVMKEVFTLVISTIKQIYPSLILTSCMILAAIEAILIILLAGKKEERVYSLKQLLNFRLSKVTVLIFFIAIIAIVFVKDTNAIVSELSLNLFFFLETLMKTMGIISIIVLLKRAPISVALKIVGYFVLIILIITPTTLLMMFGCLDTLFNYRKAEIIV